MTDKDRAERLNEELDLVSANLLREIRALRKHARKARSLLHAGRTHRAIQHVSKAMDLRFGDMAAYAEDIITQIIR